MWPYYCTRENFPANTMQTQVRGALPRTAARKFVNWQVGCDNQIRAAIRLRHLKTGKKPQTQVSATNDHYCYYKHINSSWFLSSIGSRPTPCLLSKWRCHVQAYKVYNTSSFSWLYGHQESCMQTSINWYGLVQRTTLTIPTKKSLDNDVGVL